MIRIAIAEDDFICAELLQQYLDRVGRETGRTFHVTHYGTGEDLLEQYKGQFDLILMDIEMPYCSSRRPRPRKPSRLLSLCFGLQTLEVSVLLLQ